jgi:hypothetical protein
MTRLTIDLSMSLDVAASPGVTHRRGKVAS